MNKAFEQLPESKASAIITAGIHEFSRCTYTDANTERITNACGISKGLLFHYFGTKKEFYLYCLRHALDTLTKTAPATTEGDFYGMLFAVMDSKMRLCAEHAAETMLLNMASRESAAAVKSEKDRLFAKYAGEMRSFSEKTLTAAFSTLTLKAELDDKLAVQGLSIYTSALMSRYLLQYQNAPENFFAQRDNIQKELKNYIDLMLGGICEEEK